MHVNPFVSIVLPCFNEEKYIAECLDSIISNDYDKDRMEILVIDGMSEDKTRDIVAGYMKRFHFIKFIDNPKRYQTYALNLGVRVSRGEIIIRMDCHAIYCGHYISKTVKWLQKGDVENVGGICIAKAGSNTLIARSISIAMGHPFGVGNSYFRIGLKEPRYVDTVPFGAFRKSTFGKIGLFEEKFFSSEDDEFNYRIVRNGGKILLDPEIWSYYYARDSLRTLWKQFFNYGYYKTLVFKKYRFPSSYRQIIPLLFIIFILGGGVSSLVNPFFMNYYFSLIMVYIFLCLYFSVKITLLKCETFKMIFLMPLVFITLHLAYGTGFLKGMFRLIKDSLYKIKE